MTSDELKAAAKRYAADDYNDRRTWCTVDGGPRVYNFSMRKVEDAVSLADYAAASLDDSSHVAWCRYTDRTIVTCDSDAEGAFRVYRHPALNAAERLARQVAELNRRCDRALAALRKIQKAYRRVGWEHGATMEEAIDSVDAILTDEQIEADIEREKS